MSEYSSLKMLFICFIIALIIGIVLWVIGDKIYEDGVIISGAVLTIIMIIAIILSLICIGVNYGCADADVAANKQTYDSLIYQYENDIYSNNIIYKKRLYDDIQKWNKDVAYYQAIQNNFWVGIYYPNIYDQLEIIPLK